MSKADLDNFFEKVAGSDELQNRIGDEIDAESLMKLAAEHGFEITRDELREAADPPEELDESQLESVAGGGIDQRHKGRLSISTLPILKGAKQQFGSRSPRRQGLGVIVNVGGNWYEEDDQ